MTSCKLQPIWNGYLSDWSDNNVGNDEDDDNGDHDVGEPDDNDDEDENIDYNRPNCRLTGLGREER